MAGHTHGDLTELEFPDRTRRLLAFAAIGLAVATLLGMVLLRPTGKDRPDLSGVGGAAQYVDARLLTLDDFDCPDTSPTDILRCGDATFEIIAGTDKGEVVSQDLFDLDSSAPLSPGDKVVMRHDVNAAEGFEYQYSGDRQRKPTLFWLAILFAVTVIALGRWKGVAALAGLVASLGVLLLFILALFWAMAAHAFYAGSDTHSRVALGIGISSGIAIAYLTWRRIRQHLRASQPEFR